MHTTRNLNIYFYIFFTKKVFIKNSNISKKLYKSKKYAKYIKNIPIYMPKKYLSLKNLKILFYKTNMKS